MLGKLIKHEWKNEAKFGCLMLILIAGITFLGWLAFQSPMWQSITNDTINSDGKMGVADILSIVTLMIYVFMLVGISFGTIIYMGVRFYRSMYTDEGYLTHTLPVSKHGILCSKILVNGLWYLLITLGIIVSGALLLLTLVVTLTKGTDIHIFAEMDMTFHEFCKAMEREFGIKIANWIIMVVLNLLITPFTTLCTLFGAISLGQLFTKHRVSMAIVMYILISIVHMVIASEVQNLNTLRIVQMDVAGSQVINGYMSATAVTGIVQGLVIAGILYVVTYFIVDKKLNLE